MLASVSILGNRDAAAHAGSGVPGRFTVSMSPGASCPDSSNIGGPGRFTRQVSAQVDTAPVGWRLTCAVNLSFISEPVSKFRGYDPSTGRWLSRDSIGEDGGINLYGYVNNNPVMFTDAFGLKIDTDECSKALLSTLSKFDPRLQRLIQDIKNADVTISIQVLSGTSQSGWQGGYGRIFIGAQRDDPLASLAHELQHAWDSLNRIILPSANQLYDLGIADAGEQRAQQTANIVAGMCPGSGKGRTSYNGKKIPHPSAAFSPMDDKFYGKNVPWSIYNGTYKYEPPGIWANMSLSDYGYSSFFKRRNYEAM